MMLGPDILRDPTRAATLEWLATDGRGGYASSTVIGLDTRRRHGLLVTPAGPAETLFVLLARLEETLVVGERRVALGTCAYPDTLYPRGFEQLAAFSDAPLPTWQWDVGGLRLTRTLARVAGEPATAIVYLLEGDLPARLEVRPMLAGRPADALQSENDELRPQTRREGLDFVFDSKDACPPLRLRAPGAQWDGTGYWYRRCEYARERDAGEPCHEDVFSPGCAAVTLHPGRPWGLLAWAAPIPMRAQAVELAEAERQRLRALRAGADEPVGTLRRAADAFLVRRADGRAALVADYLEGGERWRDTLVALPGVAFEARRLAEARALLARLPEELAPEPPPGVSLDVPLRGVLAAVRGLASALENGAWRRRLAVWALATVDAYAAGRVAGGALLEGSSLLAGPDGRCAIDVQALWFNVLLAGAELARGAGDTRRAGALGMLATRVRESVLRHFWSDTLGFLADAWSPADGPDLRLRARQVQALALPHALVPRDKAEALLGAVERELLTPVGLRTLAPSEAGYVGRDDPARAEDDGRGSAWPVLACAYFDALVRVAGEQGKSVGRAWLRAFERHLGEAGLGYASPCFDGDAPHLPRGSIAHAATVGELLRLALRLGPGRPGDGARRPGAVV